MADLVEAVLSAAAREFLRTRPVVLFWGLGMYEVATKVARWEHKGNTDGT